MSERSDHRCAVNGELRVSEIGTRAKGQKQQSERCDRNFDRPCSVATETTQIDLGEPSSARVH